MGSILRIGLIGLVILVLVGTLAWLLRLSAADWLLTRELARHGYPEARLEVSTLSLQQMTLRDIDLRPERGPVANRVAVSYTLGGLLRREAGNMEVEIRGLRLRLDRAPDDEPAVDPPATVAAGLIERLAPLARFSRLVILDSEVEVAQTPLGVWTVGFDGNLQGGNEGLRQAEFHGVAEAIDRGVPLDFSARYEADTMHASISYATNGAGFESHADIRLHPPWDDPRTEVFHSSSIDAEAGPAPEWWPLPWPTSGLLRLTGEQHGHLGDPAMPTGIGDLLQRLVAGEWSGEWTVEGEDLGIDNRIEGVAIEATGRVQADADGLGIDADGNGRINVPHLHPDEARRLPLPPEIGQALLATPAAIEWPAGNILRVVDDDGLKVTLTPAVNVIRPDTPTRIRLTGTGDWRPEQPLALRNYTVELDEFASEHVDIARLRARGDLTGDGGRLEVDAEMPRLQLEPMEADDVAAALRFDVIRNDAEPLRLVISEPGLLAAAGVRWAPALASDGAVRTAVTGGALRLGPDPEWTLELAAEAARWRATMFADEPLQIRTGEHTVELSGPSPLFPLARATLTNVDADIAEPDLWARGIDLDLRPGRIQGWLRFAVAALHVDGGPLPLTPLRLRGEVDDWSDEGQRIQGQGSMAADQARFDFSGRLPHDDTDARLHINWDELVFEPGGLQPIDLAPAVPALREVTGTARAGVSLRLAGDGLDGQARIQTSSLDFRLGPATVRGLEGTIAMAGVRPWRSEGDQRLDADHLELGLGIANPRVRYAIEPRPGRGGVLEIREAAGDYGGDRLFMPAWTFDPHADTHDFDVEVGPIDLATLVRDLAIPGLHAEGRVSGRIPVTWVDERIVIRDARLGGNNGHIAFRADAVDATDPDQPEAARAFTDLAYDRLDVTLDQDLDRDDVLGITARGRNPAVQEGARNTYSVHLRGDTAPLINAILTGERITREDLDRHLGPR